MIRTSVICCAFATALPLGAWAQESVTEPGATDQPAETPTAPTVPTAPSGTDETVPPIAPETPAPPVAPQLKPPPADATVEAPKPSLPEPPVVAPAPTETRIDGGEPALAGAKTLAQPEEEHLDEFVKLGLVDLLNVDIVTAGFFPTNIRNTPNYTVSVTDEQWRYSTARNIKELLDIYVPGVQMTEHFWTGALIGARGVSVDNNAKTLVLLDGQTMNMRRHFGVNSELNLPLMGDLERMETVHGPNAIVHGGGAINGVVNLIPKDAHQHPGLKMRSEMGFADQLVLAEATYGLPYGKENSLLLYAGVVASRGFEPNELEWNEADLQTLKQAGVTIRTREYALPSAKVAAYWRHGGLSFQAQALRIFDSANDAVAPFWFASADPYDHGWYRGMILVRPQYELKFNPNTSLTVSLDGQWHDFALYNKSFQKHNETEDPHGMARGGREKFYALKAVFRTTQIPNNSLAVGAQAGYRNMDDGKLFFDSDPTFGFEDGEIAWWDLSLFAEDIFEITKQFTVSAGARLDHTSYGKFLVRDIGAAINHPEMTDEDVELKPNVESTDISPRVAAVFSITENHVLKLSYGRGFRLPDAAYFGHMIKNNYIFDNNLDVEVPGAPDLGNSKSELSAELMDSIEFNSMNSFLENKLSLDLSAYYNMYHNLLSWNGYMFVNMPDTFGSVGGEVIGRAEPSQGILFSLSYGYSRPTQFTDDSYALMGSLVNADISDPANPSLKGKEWICYSGHQVKSNFTWQLLANRFFWHANFRMYSGVDVHEEAGQSEAFGANVVILNTALTYKVNPQIGLKLNFQNLTANETPSATSLNFMASNGHNGIDQRLIYLSLSGRI